MTKPSDQRHARDPLSACSALARFGYVGEAQTFAADIGADPGAASRVERAAGPRLCVARQGANRNARPCPTASSSSTRCEPAAWFLRPRQRVFMDARRSSPLTQIFVRVEPTDACRQWRAMEDDRRGLGGTRRLALRFVAPGPDQRPGWTLKYRRSGDTSRAAIAGSIRGANSRSRSRMRTARGSALEFDRRRAAAGNAVRGPGRLSQVRSACSSSSRSSRATSGSSRRKWIEDGQEPVSKDPAYA